ncbi:sugar translocase [Halobacteriales archaeon QH_8_68_33]|nr:MAG: sugar translocase [Halobacteriales archaeon QH_8_68_33]
MSDGTALGDRARSLLSGVRFGKFVSVGAVGAVCDTVVLVTLKQVVGAPPELAWLAGVETAIIVMFLINENWTFAGHGTDDRASFLRRLGRSHVVRAGGVTTQFVIFEGVYRLLFRDVLLGDIGLWVALTGGFGVPLAGLDVWLLVAKGLGVGVGMVVNYVFESLFTWRVHQ